MSNIAIKDPTVSKSVIAFRSIFSRTTGCILSSAITVQLARPHLGQILEQITGSSDSGPLGNAAVLLGAATVGYGVGYGWTSALRWLRWKLIQRLLTYSGWIFEQRSAKTKAWGLALKFLVGPGPHKLYEFEDALPVLPLPTLEETCTKFLESVKPLLTLDEYEHTKSLVESFKNTQGPTLQKYIEKRQKKLRSWLADWWLTTAYLSRRESIAINVNFFMMCTLRPDISSIRLARAANSLYQLTDYYEMVVNENLPPDMIMDMVPVSMESVKGMLASCRIPGEHVDSLTRTSTSRHTVVISNGIYYRVEMYVPGGWGPKARLSQVEIKKQLEYIEKQSRGVKNINAVAVLTTAERQVWAKNREMLLRSPTNAATIKDIETAIVMCVISNYKPKDNEEIAKLGYAGDGTTRWFDKGMTIEIFEDYCRSTANMEHSGADATHFNIMFESCMAVEKYAPDGDVISIPGQKARTLPLPTRLEWDISDEMQTIIDNTLTEYKTTLDAVDLVHFHTEYGKKWMKKQRISPDGYLQMAIQLAYWRIHGEFTKTYEPASHRLFAMGRTDNINPVSELSIKWVKAMVSPDCPPETKLKLLRESIKYQSQLRLEATAGYGCDRHMLGFCCAARELGMDTHPLFNDKAYNLPMKLSTSQVPTNVGQLPMLPETVIGGFGPTSPDGYGLLYVCIGDDMFNFNITSFKTCPETDSRRLAEGLRMAMRDMKQLMEEQNPLTRVESKQQL